MAAVAEPEGPSAANNVLQQVSNVTKRVASFMPNEPDTEVKTSKLAISLIEVIGAVFLTLICLSIDVSKVKPLLGSVIGFLIQTGLVMTAFVFLADAFRHIAPSAAPKLYNRIYSWMPECIQSVISTPVSTGANQGRDLAPAGAHGAKSGD